MSDRKKPTPVAILVVPRFEDGEPTCKDCAFQFWRREGMHSFMVCSLGREHNRTELSGRLFVTPGEACIVHGPPETRQEAF